MGALASIALWNQIVAVPLTGLDWNRRAGAFTVQFMDREEKGKKRTTSRRNHQGNLERENPYLCDLNGS